MNSQSGHALLPNSGLGLAAITLNIVGIAIYFIHRWLLMNTANPTGLHFLYVGGFVVLAIGFLIGITGLLQKGRNLSLPFTSLLVNVGFWAYFLLFTTKQ